MNDWSMHASELSFSNILWKLHLHYHSCTELTECVHFCIYFLTEPNIIAVEWAISIAFINGYPQGSNAGLADCEQWHTDHCTFVIACLWMYNTFRWQMYVFAQPKCTHPSASWCAEVEYGSRSKRGCVVSLVRVFITLKRWPREQKCSECLPTTTNPKFNLRRVQQYIVCLPSNR